MNVLEHLTHEHREVERLLDLLAESDEGPEREATLTKLESSLGTHMAVEERFVYPIVKDVLGAEDKHEGVNEHDLARDGLAKMRELVAQPGFGAAVDMVKAGIGHHVEEEENDMFPELRRKAAERIAALGSPEELEAQVESAGQDEAALKGEVSGTGRVSDDLTRDELYEQAKEADIDGRSSMTKDELKQALSKS
jgi:iron-sulfur cluster repair protein YtfE (RIC family)